MLVLFFLLLGLRIAIQIKVILVKFFLVIRIVLFLRTHVALGILLLLLARQFVVGHWHAIKLVDIVEGSLLDALFINVSVLLQLKQLVASLPVYQFTVVARNKLVRADLHLQQVFIVLQQSIKC